MIINKLIVKKTKPSIEVIRDIKFHSSGLNLIIDNTSENTKETGNNVGKTTLIKIIDLCLGARSVREIYYDADTKSNNEVIKKFIEENKVQAELLLTKFNGDKSISIKRDLFLNGSRYINNKSFNEINFNLELKKLIFNSSEKSPSYRQLLSKFIRITNTSAESMIKFLNGSTKTATYDAIYSYLFKLLDNDLVSERDVLYSKLNDSMKTIELLENNPNIGSINVLKQKNKIIENELNELINERSKLSYMETYKQELEIKRKLTTKIKDLEEIRQTLDFEISTIMNSIDKLDSDKSNINLSILKNIYAESKTYIPFLQKKFEDLVLFHNSMIQNRIDFVLQQLKIKQDKFEDCTNKINILLKEKEKITIDILDEGLLDELNLLNSKIEELYTHKGEISQSLKLLEEQETIKSNLSDSIGKIIKLMDEDYIDKNLNIFNKYFGDYCEKLYDEKYILAYEKDWKSKNIFPISLKAFDGNVGTGKKKAVIVAFDLAYLKYAEHMKIDTPMFVIHDKLENTHINQLKTIFEVCETINGQYIIPILKERINKLENSEIENAKIIELSQNDKFFKI